MCEAVSELKAATPSTLLHPCSIFQGCQAYLDFTKKKREHREIREGAQGHTAVSLTPAWAPALK